MFAGLSVPLTAMPLVAKYATLTAAEVTPQIIREVAEVLGLPLPETAVTALMAARDAVKPEESALKWLSDKAKDGTLATLVNPENAVVLTRCSHCNQPNSLSGTGLVNDGEGGYLARCAHCGSPYPVEMPH